jgi:hypothetical protein
MASMSSALPAPQQRELEAAEAPFEVRQAQGHRRASLHAARSFEPGATLMTFTVGAVVSQSSFLTIQVGEREHVSFESSVLRYVNHSCEPNVHFDVPSGRLECIRAIAQGDEVVAFYPATEWEMAEGFVCNCGTPSCLGRVDGASRVPHTVLSRHRLASHIRARLECHSGTRST